MKALINSGALSLALLLGGCGDDGANSTAAVGNDAAPLEQVAAPNGDWTEMVTQTEAGGFLMGNPDAPVKLVEYASLTCPHCAAFSEASSDALKNQYVKSGQVSFEFRNFVMNPVDLAASMLVRCQGTGPFFRLTETLFAQQDEWAGRFSEIPAAEMQRIQSLPASQQVGALAKAGEIDQFFRMRGMPEAQIDACLSDEQGLKKLVEMNSVAVNEHQVGGTPTFLINGEQVGNVTTWEGLEPLLRGAIG